MADLDAQIEKLSAAIAGVLSARVDRLRLDNKQILQRASVIGRIFQWRVLACIY